jgi:hypothetical protein
LVSGAVDAQRNAAMLASNYLSSGFDWERVVLFENDGLIVIVDRVLAQKSGERDLRLLWHIKGELFHRKARAFSFKQGEESLHLLCSTDTIASQWKMARQDNVGTGCPPGSYELYWGQPCFQLSQPVPLISFDQTFLSKRKVWKPFEQASWTNVFSDKVIETQTFQFIQEETHAGVISRSDKETSTVGVRFDLSVHCYGDIESDAKAFWAMDGMESQNFAWTDGKKIRLLDLNVIFSAPVDAIISLGKRRGECHAWATTDVHLSLTSPEGQFQADLSAGECSLTLELKPRDGEGSPKTGQR